MALISVEATRRIREIRRHIDHPVIDADGHLLESVPLLFEYVEKEGGRSAREGFARALGEVFTGTGDRATGSARGPWWPMTADAEYQATVTAPGLLAERLEDLGIDYSIVYPSLGLALCTLPDAELRRLLCRALNRLNADLCRPHARRLAVSAVIPMHTPEEACSEIEYCVRELGLKVAMIPPAVARPLTAHPEAFPAAHWMDRYGIDSAHDYDRVWQAFCDLGVAVGAHGGIGFRYLPAGRCSPSNYAYNHVLGHADLQEGLCRALVFGGVPHRFPELRFLFLEGGVLWAIGLLQAIEEHWEKRSLGLSVYDPSRLDRARLAEILRSRGLPAFPPVDLQRDGPQPWVRDEFAGSGIGAETDLLRFFSEQFFFGCESDDRGIHRAFDAAGNPLGARLRPLFSSDIGHWDVPTLGDVLPQSRALPAAGLLSEVDYRRFVFEFPAQAHAHANPTFFQGTAVEESVRGLLEGSGG
jgi:predicted TIM-barrel fold metal-dependent hydrolase